MPRKNEVRSYTVFGAGQFPLDMLRYDAAWPSEQQDVVQLEGRGMRSVVLTSRSDPTPARWASFMWNVVPGVNRTIHAKVLHKAIEKDGVVDVSNCLRDEQGDYILDQFNEHKELDYRVGGLGGEAIWSIGKDDQTGRIVASTTGRFYQNPVYRCLWLR